MDSKAEDIVIEVLESSEIPENELRYFQETQPLKVEDIIIEDVAGPSTSKSNLQQKQLPETQEVLIKKYLNGEVAFSEFYTSLEADIDEDDEEQDIPQNATSSSTTIKIDKHDLSKLSSLSSSSSSYLLEMKQIEEQQSKEKKVYRKKSVLSAALQGLMGEANLCFARGQIDMVETICLEIIRQNPLASEPFVTLAQIYESKDPEKYLEFLTIATYLDPTNRDQWIRIAEMNIEKKNYQQARSCLSKAIKSLPKEYEIRIMKAQLLELMNDEKDKMYTLLRMIPILPAEKSEYCLVTAKNVAKYYHKNHKMQYALDAMRNAYKVAGKIFSTEDINLYLELLLVNKFYDTVLCVLKSFAHIEYITEEDTENNEISVVACVFPDDLLPDFRIKACVSLIHLKACHLIHYIINNILEFIPIDSGIDWYMDIAEAMMREKKYIETLSLLEKVIENGVQLPAYTWLRHAECHRALGNVPEAIASYQIVVELAPFCYDAKFTLSALLKQQGKHKEAIKALEQDLDAETFDPRLLYEYCLMLKTVDEIDQYIEGGYILLARNSLKLRTRIEMLTASDGANYYKPGTLKSIVEWRLDGTNKEEVLNCKDNESVLSMDEEYNLFKDLLKVCYDRQKFGMMQKLCFAMITSRKFRSKFKELEKLIMLSSLYNDDTLIAFMFLREILSRNTDKTIYWNFANLLIQKYDSLRYYRYFKRLLTKIQTESQFKIFLANYHLSAGSYKYALNLYVSIFKDTMNPLLALCITVVFSQMSTQKNSLKRQTAAAQAIAFARKYSELRLSSVTMQEVYYNVGRIYHHSGLPHMALEYYTKALQVENEFISQHENILGLREEIAFNIHLIYKASGNLEMARKYLYKYIVV